MPLPAKRTNKTQVSASADIRFTLRDRAKTVRATPLVIQLPAPNGDVAEISLSAPWEGLFFDILGRNSVPRAFTKTLISWLSPASRLSNYFISLPDENGIVRGIDQLFGDNTFGPDGKYAANGFAALAKHDSNLDGVINPADDVYAKLRLWSDRDGDGVAIASELFTLAELNVQSIDLQYDPNYREADRYGNEVKYKSVASTADGSLHLVYDIWFNLDSRR